MKFLSPASGVAARLALHLFTFLAFFLLSHPGHVLYTLEPKFPSPAPYLTFNYTTDFFFNRK